MKEKIQASLKEVVNAAKQMEKTATPFIESVATMIANAYQRGKKIILAGNGGSLCDAMHFAEEMTGYYREKRPALPAICLSDPGHLTCVGNDTCFEDVFARGVEAHGQEGDVLILLTTSGNSENLLRAAKVAKQRDLKTIAFLGKTGGKLAGVCDLEWIVQGYTYSDRIQEVHMAAIHIIIEMIEERLFSQEVGDGNEHLHQKQATASLT